jgi:prepilin-type N-terminal cleavage/methylation domain-containing protein
VRRRGFTILEVLVVVAVFGLLIGVIGAVAVLVHRYSRQSLQVSDAQREAVSCLRAVAADLGRARGATWKTDGAQGYWFLSNRPPESESSSPTFDSVSGQVLWRTWVGLWLDPTGEVRRSEIVLPGAGMAFADIDPNTWPSALSSFSVLPRRRVLARRISRFSLQTSGRACSVEIESVTTRAGNPPTRYFVVSSYLLQ